MSVCGTGAAWVKLSGFSREYDYPHYQIPPRRTPYSQVQLGWWICLPSSTPTLFNGDFRRPAVVSLLRLHVAPCGSDGILTVSAIAIAVRLRLRTRLTPADWHCPGNLGLTAGGNLTLLIVTYSYICFTHRSRITYVHHSTL